MFARVLARIGALLATIAPVCAQQGPVPSNYVKPEAPGRLVAVDGARRLHILCKGEATGPVVIFEAGLSQFTANTTFGTAQDAIAPFARVCTYDRAGLGWSDPAPGTWSHAGMVADLHRLLAAAGIRGPIVLVAHSLGGPLARAYARTHPDAVAGLVLVDSTTDRHAAELARARIDVVAQLDAAIAAARPGTPVIGFPAGTPAETMMAYTPEILRGVKAEFLALDGIMPSLPAEMTPGRLGRLPLLVIRRGRTAQPPSDDDRVHREEQEALLSLSSNSAMIVAENSGHTIPLDEPQVVAAAVRRMLDALRDRRPLS